VSVEYGDGSEVVYKVRLDAEFQTRPISAVYITKTEDTNLILSAPLALREKTASSVETYFMVSGGDTDQEYALILIYAESSDKCSNSTANLFVLQVPSNNALD
jgi:hypothetical protein